MKKFIILLLVALASNLQAQGVYMEMKVSSSGQSELGNMKMYSQDGNTRAEITMSLQGMSMDITSLYLKQSPAKVYLLNAADKTYSVVEHNNSEEWKDYPQDEYEITVVGKEKVNNYTATHVMIKRKGQTSAQDLWLTTEIKDYAVFADVKTKYTGKANLIKALDAKGVKGVPVRIKFTESGQNLQIDLVKAEKKNNAASLFSLEGYTQSTSPTVIDPKQMQDMMRRMQEMTPEERVKMLEQIKKQYGGN